MMIGSVAPQSARYEPLESRRLLSAAAPTPFLGHPFNITTDTIEAENFDNGGEGVAYHDTTPANIGGQYRNTAVDVVAAGSNGFSVGHTAAGEWLVYSLNVATAGTYQFQSSVAEVGTGAAFHMEIDGRNVTGSIAVPNTGNWRLFQPVTSGPFTLSAGPHVMRVMMDRNGTLSAVGNFDFFRFLAAIQPPPPQPGPINYTWTNGAHAPI